LPEAEIWKGLARAGVPVFSEPARGIRALGKMVRFVEARNKMASGPSAASRTFDRMVKSEVDQIIARATDRQRKVLNEVETKQLFKACGLTVPRGGLARSAAEANALAAEIGRPVALKAVSPDLPHKSEAGVIRLNVDGARHIEQAYDDIVARAHRSISAARLDGILVEEMIAGDPRELIVGARQDLRFGPVVTFGLGGIFVEAIGDFAVHPAPLTPDEARGLIRRIRGYRLLTGFRGRPAADLEAIARTLCLLGDIASGWREQIAEIEINPLFVLPEGSGVIVGDALAALQ
jgi:acyl-CoA synthetase (NDP forming)